MSLIICVISEHRRDSCVSSLLGNLSWAECERPHSASGCHGSSWRTMTNILLPLVMIKTRRAVPSCIWGTNERLAAKLTTKWGFWEVMWWLKYCSQLLAHLVRLDLSLEENKSEASPRTSVSSSPWGSTEQSHPVWSWLRSADPWSPPGHRVSTEGRGSILRVSSKRDDALPRPAGVLSNSAASVWFRFF